MKKLVLGLYGLSKNQRNISGYDVITDDEAIEILKKAWEIGIRFVDTAPSYGNGNADVLIKKMRNSDYNFKLISKIGLDIQNNKFFEDNDFLKNELFNLKNNHLGNVHSVLLHSPTRSFLSSENNLSTFYENVKNILGDKTYVGISLRNPEDLILLNNFKKNIFIESNLSWFDLRLLNHINNSNRSRFKIIARSIYASGILKIILNGELNAMESFQKYDVRSTWDINKLLLENKEDIKRIQNVKQILSESSLSEFGFSLFPILSSLLFGIIIGPLSIKELLDSEKSNNKKFSNEIQKDLREIINIYNPELLSS